MAKKTYLFLFGLVFVVAVFFRIFALGSTPPGVYPDEAINGNDAITALEQNDFRVFYPENNGREGLYINLVALGFRFFGVGFWQLKLVSVSAGILTILAVAFLCHQLFPRKKAQIISLLSSFFIAVSFWHINFSRIAFRAILIPLILTGSLAFLYWAKRRKNILGYALSGAFLGLGFHTYIAFRIAPLIFVVPFASETVKLFKQRYQGFFRIFKKGLLRWGVWLLLALLVFAPLGFYFYQNPASFLGRSTQVSILNSEQPLKILGENILKTLGQFNVFGDSNWRHNLSGQPLLFPFVGSLFLLGLGWAVFNIFNFSLYRKKSSKKLEASFVLLAWWGIMLVPEFFSNEGLPHALRGIGALVPSYIFAALGFWVIWQWLAKIENGKGKKTISVFLILALLALPPIAYYRYFVKWGQSQETSSVFNQRFKTIGEIIKSRPDKETKFVIVNEGGVPVPYPDGLPMPVQSVIFSSYPEASRVYLRETEWPKAPGNNYSSAFSVFMLADNQALWEKIKNANNGSFQEENGIKYFISPGELN